ncbi:MAG: PLP-dependent aminotransferase family protein [Acidobacteriota bacterium]
MINKPAPATGALLSLPLTQTASYRFARRMSKIGVSAVREILKVTEQPDIISFAGGLPAPELFPVEVIADAHAAVFRESGAQAMQYSTTEGWMPLRQWIARRQESRGIHSDAGRILITTGSQQGIDLVAKMFINPGDKIIVENPTYLAAIQVFNAYEAEFVTVESDDDGMRVDEVGQAIIEHHPKFIYIVTDFHNPKGTSLTLERRKQLIEISRRFRIPILEDNPYGELRYRGELIPSLASLDKDGLVIYLSTFSKTLSPGMRIGWVSAPEEIFQELVVCKQSVDLHTCTIEQRAAAKALEIFDYEAHIKNLRQVYGERCLTMIHAIEKYFPAETQWTRPEGGLFLWLEFPETLDVKALFRDALAEKVAFVPGAPFFAVEARQHFARLNFSNSKPAMIEEGIRRLGQVIKKQLS